MEYKQLYEIEYTLINHGVDVFIIDLVEREKKCQRALIFVHTRQTQCAYGYISDLDINDN